MKHKLGKSSLLKLSSVRDDLYKVVVRANEISNTKYGLDFGVGEGARTYERQVTMLNAGATTTLKSRHIIRPNESKCHAVDLYAYVGGEYVDEVKYYQVIAKSMFQAAIELGVQIEWGGHWVSFRDLFHFQLSWEFYP